jgi:hypothetical protein
MDSRLRGNDDLLASFICRLRRRRMAFAASMLTRSETEIAPRSFHFHHVSTQLYERTCGSCVRLLDVLAPGR